MRDQFIEIIEKKMSRMQQTFAEASKQMSSDNTNNALDTNCG